jgi:hypothetical protein
VLVGTADEGAALRTVSTDINGLRSRIRFL